MNVGIASSASDINDVHSPIFLSEPLWFYIILKI